MWCARVSNGDNGDDLPVVLVAVMVVRVLTKVYCNNVFHVGQSLPPNFIKKSLSLNVF